MSNPGNQSSTEQRQRIARVIRVFVASPGDVAEERKGLAAIVGELNAVLTSRLLVTLELVRWETHIRPDAGIDAQDVINNQLQDDYDVFVGLMWLRFGTSTNRAGSGTEEEFLRAMARIRSANAPMAVMFYFKNALPANLGMIDAGQFAKVQEFKSALSSRHGFLYSEFVTAEEFLTKAFAHLLALILDMGLHVPTKYVGPSAADPPSDIEAAVTLGTEDRSIVEYAETGADAMSHVNESIHRMSFATTTIGERIAEASQSVRATNAGGNPDIRMLRRVANSMADKFNSYAHTLIIETPEFRRWHTKAAEAFEKMMLLALVVAPPERTGVRHAYLAIQEYRTAIEAAKVSLQDLKESVVRTPRLTPQFNQAKERTGAALGDLLSQLGVAANQILDLQYLMEKFMNLDSEARSSK